MKTKRLLVITFISVIIAGPLGGFVFGFLNCSDCGSNIFSRAFTGSIMAILTPLSGGFPPQNEGGVGAPFNAWPHIIFAAIITFVILLYRERRNTKKE
ncbi:MAG: hypothetical protein NTU80_13565 [Verrucomicrobia bacterium]|nr:hypothetical protein [Verrucomicrobiota bacterium]